MSQTNVNAHVDVFNCKPINFSDGGKQCRLLRSVSIAAVISFCVNIGLVVFLSVNQGKHNNRHERHATGHLGKEDDILRNSLCVECHVLGMSRDQALVSRSVSLMSVRGGHLCCLPDADGLWRLLNLLIVKAMMLKQPKKLGLSMPPPLPSVHLYLDTSEDNYYKWSEEYGFGAAHVIRPIQLKNGRLCIEKAGLYNIYSFITLKRRTEVSRPTTINHSIRKISSGTTPHTDVILQTSVDLPRKSETFNASYLSGVVRLQSKDELYVDVSDVKAVYGFAPSNFFGLHLIQEV